MIKAGKAKILGPGNNRLNVVYAGNIAEAPSLPPIVPTPTAKRTTSPTTARSPSSNTSISSPARSAPRR
jgi:hypothetical protein